MGKRRKKEEKKKAEEKLVNFVSVETKFRLALSNELCVVCEADGAKGEEIDEERGKKGSGSNVKHFILAVALDLLSARF